jgi:hypothetical protein
VAVVGLAALAACGDDDDSADKTTTTTTEATTTTADSSTTTAAEGDLAAGPNYVETSGPSGSGCTPGENATELPAGWWAGEIKKVYESGVDFDLVCWYQGGAATEIAQQKGEEATDDYFVVNDNPRTFNVQFPPGMTGSSCIDQNGQRFACELNDVLQLYRVSLDQEIPTSMLGDSELVAFPTMWIHTTADGKGDYSYMQFTP